MELAAFLERELLLQHRVDLRSGLFHRARVEGKCEESVVFLLHRKAVAEQCEKLVPDRIYGQFLRVSLVQNPVLVKFNLAVKHMDRTSAKTFRPIISYIQGKDKRISSIYFHGAAW